MGFSLIVSFFFFRYYKEMKHAIFFLFFLFVSTSLFSQSDLTLSIEPLSVHFIDAKEKLINLSVRNDSLNPVDLMLSKNALKNIYLEVYDELAFPVSVNPRIVYMRETEDSKLETMRLESNDVYTMQVDIEDHVNFRNLGVYSVSMRFYPTSPERSKEYVVSNTALFSLLDESEAYNNTTMDADFYTTSTVQAENYMIPDEVVDAALGYLQASDWDSFFGTVNLRELYLNTAQSKNNFANLDVYRQRQELLNFSEKIKNDEIYGFLTDTEKFTIEETRKTASKAMVTTLLSKISSRVLNTRRYTFFLEKKQNAWRIVNFNTKMVSSERMQEIIPNERLLSNLDYLLPAEFVTGKR